MKTIFSGLIIILLHTILFAVCPKMQKKYYYVNSIKFENQYEARYYLMQLKRKEIDGWNRLEVGRKDHYNYTAKWVWSKDHGHFCVCKDCR